MHYNDPDISNRDFLTCVMHDPSLPLADRMRAAKALLKIGPPPPPPPQPSLTIQITGISAEDMEAASWWSEWVAFSLEMQAYRRTLPKAEQDEIVAAVNRCMRRNELGVDLLDPMSEVKGHA